MTADLTETQASKLSERIQNLVNMTTADIATLHSELIQAEGALRAASVPLSLPLMDLRMVQLSSTSDLNGPDTLHHLLQHSKGTELHQ